MSRTAFWRAKVRFKHLRASLRRSSRPVLTRAQWQADKLLAHLHVGWLAARRHTKPARQRLRPVVIAGAVVVVTAALAGWAVARRAHHHSAKRPHLHLLERWQWYRRWHEVRWHPHVHYSIVAAGVIALIINFGLYRLVFASDITQSWTFNNAGDYTLSDSNAIEVTGAGVRLKAQNYATDANTRGLWHFDETSGATATDSSGNGNDGTVTGAGFTTGNLNNALSFNNANHRLSAPDSPSLSLSQQNSLEAWTKFNSQFSAGSLSQRACVVDKGDYQLYFDNETGKVTYELADNSANGWTAAAGNDVNGGWDTNGKRAVNASVKLGSHMYVGIGADAGDAEVWRFDGSTWSLVGGGPNSVNGSWAAQTFEGVYALATDGTNLYAGLGLTAGDGEVWRYDGNSWAKIGGDGINSSWAASTFEQVWSLTHFNGALYAGLGSSANDAEVWRWDDSSWTKIGGDSVNSGWTTGYEIVASLTNDGTNLYAGLGVTAGDAEVWRYNGSSWTKIGGDSLNSSWDSTIETVRTLRHLNGTLYAGLGDTAGDADVYSWNGNSWTKLGGDDLNGSWAAGTYEQVGAFAHDGTSLYVGLGTSNGDGEVWRLTSGTWTQMGGDGVNNSWATAAADTVNTLTIDGGILYAGTYDSAGSGWVYTWDGDSWSLVGGNYVNKSWGYYGLGAVQVMQNVGDYLYAGLGNTAGASLVWRYDGSSWSIIGGQGINGSWAPNTYEQVISMASHGGNLYVGLGTTAGEAEVWQWDGNSWTQVGGDAVANSWTTGFEEVSSLASYGNYLYAGLGASANDGEVWRYDGNNWTKIGGDNLNSGWATNFDRVAALSFYEGQLVAGLGASAGEAEVWRWNGATWAKIGGDGVAGSWTGVYEQVETIIPYNGKLYAGLGNSADDAELWEYNGGSWTQIGGDDINGSWTAGTYERVKTLAVYNGDLYAGLGTTAGDGEVWRYSGSSWTKIGGNGINGGWGSTIEEVESFSAYRGKFYAGLGITANADTLIYSWGNNGFLQSSTASFDDNWHHIAATYDGATMKIFIDGVLNGSTTTSISLPDSSRPLLIGAGYGGREFGKPAAVFEGLIDEVRISNVARNSFTTLPYSNTPQTVTAASVYPAGVASWDSLAADETAAGGAITFRLSADNGATWLYWTGSVWGASTSLAQANSVADISDHLDSFPVTPSGFKWQAILTGNGNQQVRLNGLSLDATADATAPTNGSNLAMLKSAGGTSLASNAWTNDSQPFFSWTAGSDTQSDIRGYCAYIGTDSAADPSTTKGLLGTSPGDTTGDPCPFIIPATSVDFATPSLRGSTWLTSSTSPYYFRLRALDNAGNISATTIDFQFRFDNTQPVNPAFITTPSQFVSSKTVTLTWPTVGGNAASDADSGLVGLQYRIGASGTWYGDSHSGTQDATDVLVNDGSYTTQDPPDFAALAEGNNNVYVRTWDAAGNVSTAYVTGVIKLNTSSPSSPQNVTAVPPTNTTNSFAFTWLPPASFAGEASDITYCYTINTLPSAGTCTFTSAGVTSLGAGAYATQPGENTFYVVAKDEAGNINYATYGSATFTANTAAPGMPLNIEIADISVKSSSSWKLAISWEPPSDAGSGISTYKVYRSTNNVSFTHIASNSGASFVDTGLNQQRYYYRVRACDSANNCGAYSATVDELPTGRFTSPAGLTSDPAPTNISTRRATISWSTDRASDSKIALGTTSGVYSGDEISNSNQVTSHTITLTNLQPGTTYYYKAKWTDEDGNTGLSSELSFTTLPAPTVKEVQVRKVALTSATIQFTTREAVKARVLYGATEGFGGSQILNTSSAESTYTVELSGLADGVKYFYRIDPYDSDGNAYEGNVFSITTPERPRISNLRFQPVAGEPTSTQKVTWTTNVPASSLVRYGLGGQAPIEKLDSTLTREHEVLIRNLTDDSLYSLTAESRDGDGNVAVSDNQTFRTALDTRPPALRNLTIETTIRGTGAEARGQVVVSWETDEPATSQVAYGEGASGTTYTNRTSEDTALVTRHTVIISDLPTSKVFHLQAISRDGAENAGQSEDRSTIVGRASDSIIGIIFNALQNVFSFLE